MNQILTQKEIERTQQLCFSNPAKACAIAQAIVDTCQVVSCSTYSHVKNKSLRTIQYQAAKHPGIHIEGRKFISINQ